ncbi:MAG: type II toxin-antitoxin system RelE/ParE family toxin [Paludibacter sp.]|nr:type II toxin-antitoxin system RelE/ParE family toxin [Paludibacter sp.]
MKSEEIKIREVVLSNEFFNYYNGLNVKVQDKYIYALQLIETLKVVSEKFIKKIQNTEFYEVRVSVSTNEYRTMFIAVDNPNFMEATKVILLNSFLKKDNKQYKKEITKARAILAKEELL